MEGESAYSSMDPIVRRYAAHLEETASNKRDELESVISNVRWLATLALAMAGGLVAYRDLSGDETLSLPVATAIVLLAMTLGVFIIAAIKARFAQSHIMDTTRRLKTDFIKGSLDDKASPAEKRDKTLKKLAGIENNYVKRCKYVGNIENLGLLWLLFSALYTGFVVVGMETWKLMFS